LGHVLVAGPLALAKIEVDFGELYAFIEAASTKCWV
jgi:hypothetical protein